MGIYFYSILMTCVAGGLTWFLLSRPTPEKVALQAARLAGIQRDVKSKQDSLLNLERDLQSLKGEIDLALRKKLVSNARESANRLKEEARIEAKIIRDKARAEATWTKDEAKAQAAAIKGEAQQKYENIRDRAAKIKADIREHVGRLKSECKEIEQSARTKAGDIVDTARQKSSDLLSAAKSNSLEVERSATEAAALVKRKAEEESENQLAAAMNKVHAALSLAAEANNCSLAGVRFLTGADQQAFLRTSSYIDDLLLVYGNTDVAHKLREAKDSCTHILQTGLAVRTGCPYPELAQRTTRLVLSYFDSRVDLLMRRVKTLGLDDLLAGIMKAGAEVNIDAPAFWGSHVSDEYVLARAEEARWSWHINELRRLAQEEQREIKAKQREEEKVLREHEKAARDALREQEQILKAIERHQLEAQRRTEEMERAFQSKLDSTRAERELLEREQETYKADQASRLSELEQKLAEAEERGRRELSMAQQTKAGNVYVISNEGSFGAGIYKIGMTRRLDPMDRVRELGDASVPFTFDVHGMIWSNDAPALESKLHKLFAKHRVNKINFKKEFFRTSVAEIREAVEKLGFESTWTMEAQAVEYFETRQLNAKIDEDPGFWERWLASVGRLKLLEASVDDDETLTD